ncbi:MAG: ATP-binding cassette domain-containing protein [Thermomicrobiales bacterium]|nr:ATP-binding cassette domain-containing protein [Thermomicrobiales bacterium]
MSAPSTPILELKQVGKSFEVRGHGAQGRLRALDDVSLAIARQQIVGIVGESGCGKSTLARVVVRLETPTDGSIAFEGRPIDGLSGRDLLAYRRKVQLVFQDPYSALAPRMSVEDAIEEPLRIHKIGDAGERKRRVARLLDLVGLARNLGARYPHQLSGGQRQRVNIARALALEPSLLLLDEPVSALDVSIQAQVLNLLRDLQQELGLTYLFISHDLRVVRYLCDTVAVMYLGRVVEHGPADEVFAQPRHPYTLALLLSIPDHSAAHDTHTVVLTGEVPSPVNVPSGCAFHTRCPLAREVCRIERPALREVTPGRWSACHFAEEVSDETIYRGAPAGATV